MSSAKHNNKYLQPVNLRTATVADLRRIPGIDRYLAEQIHAAVQNGTVRSVDDLVKVKGTETLRVAKRNRLTWQ